MTMIYGQIIEILTEVRNIVNSSDTNIVWTRFESVDKLLEELDYCIQEVNKLEESINVYERIGVLFAPTGPLQNISIDSGWSTRYYELSKLVDELIAIRLLSLEDVFKV